MDVKEITYLLVPGQVNLDRMKKEIYDLMHLFMGLVRFQRCAWDKGEEWAFRSKKCRWILKVNDYRGPKMFAIICEMRIGDEAGSSSAFSINENAIELNLDQIEVVYDDLPTFVGGMLETFPGLRKEIQSHLKAAGKQF